MELAKEHVLPERVDLVFRVRVCLCGIALSPVQRCESGDEFEIVQEDFGLAVVALDRAVRRGGTAVELEIQLGDPEQVREDSANAGMHASGAIQDSPDWELLALVGLLEQVVVELLDGRTHVHFRDLASPDLGVVGHGAATTQVLEHGRKRTTAAVAVAVSEQAGLGRLERFVVAPGIEHVVDRSLGSVLQRVRGRRYASNREDHEMLTVFCGHMWTTICVWSWPCHRNVVCGKSLNCDQLSLGKRPISFQA